jgi:hypothetical protein
VRIRPTFASSSSSLASSKVSGRHASLRATRVLPGRIDVRAAGLNFRDVLCALGLYPGAWRRSAASVPA